MHAHLSHVHTHSFVKWKVFGTQPAHTPSSKMPNVSRRGEQRLNYTRRPAPSLNAVELVFLDQRFAAIMDYRRGVRLL